MSNSKLICKIFLKKEVSLSFGRINPMRKILFVVNPVSGGKDKKAVVKAIRDALASENVEWEIKMTTYAGEAEVLARESDADVVVAVGGDGTVRELACGLLGSDKALGIIPCGSGDGLALHLGISRNVKKAMGTLLEGCTEMIDYALVNGQPFFCTTGVGMDAIVANKFALSRSRGFRTYINEAFQTWYHYPGETYNITVDGKEHVLPAVIVTIGNINQWGNEARITPLASVTDGMLDVAVMAPFGAMEIPVLAAKLMDGRLQTSRRVTMLRGRKVILRRGSSGPAHLDGDPCEMGEEIVAEIVPSALKAIVNSRHKL